MADISVSTPAVVRPYRENLRQALDANAFFHYFWASTYSTAGRALHATVIGYIVYDLSHSGFLLGLVAFMQMVPQLLLAPIVGVVVDRVDRRRILMLESATQVVSLLILGLLALTGNLSVPAIAAIVVVVGIASAFDYPARSALLPMVVPIHTLLSANAFYSLAGNIARIGVPLLAGVLIDSAGVGIVLLLGAAIYVPASTLAAAIPLSTEVLATTAAHTRHALAPGARSSARRDMGDAITYIRATPLLRASLVNDIAPYLFGMSYLALLPAITSDTLDGGARMLGLLFGLVGAGALLGTLVATGMSGHQRRGRTIWVTMLGTGAGILLIAYGDSLLIIAAGLLVTGIFQTIYVIQNDTLIQTFAEERFRGRALAVQSMINGLMPFGLLLAGVLAELWSTSIALAVTGGAMVLSALHTALFRPDMRNLR